MKLIFILPVLSDVSMQAHANMCAGYYKLMVAAKQEKKILTPSPQFDNEQVRYEHRFAPFTALLTPPLMPYSQFKVCPIILKVLIDLKAMTSVGSVRTHRKRQPQLPLHCSLQGF